MSERRIRAAEWSAFASKLDRRAKSAKAEADRTGNMNLMAIAIALLGASTDATALAFEIRGGVPFPDGEDDDDEGSATS